MKKILLLLAIMGMFSMALSFAIYIINGDSKNQKYSLSGNRKKIIIWDRDIVLREDYIVKENQTLIIKPGITIYLKEGTSIVIRGELKAVGNKSNPINFRGNKFNEAVSS